MKAGREDGGGAHTRQTAQAAEERVHDEIVSAVMEHRLPPGAKLDEELLSKLFGVSRTRLRKVLDLLANEGIVTQRLNHGAYVSQPSIKEARDIFVARRGVEDMVVRLVAAQRSSKGLAALRSFVKREAKAYANHARDTNHLSGDFHVILADLAGNQVLCAFARQLAVRTNLVQALYGPPHICLVHQHEDIIDALEAGDADKAAHLMADHLQAIEQACDLRDRARGPVDLRAVFSNFDAR